MTSLFKRGPYEAVVVNMPFRGYHAQIPAVVSPHGNSGTEFHNIEFLRIFGGVEGTLLEEFRASIDTVIANVGITPQMRDPLSFINQALVRAGYSVTRARTNNGVPSDRPATSL